MKKIIFNHKSYLTYDEINNYKKEISKIIPEKYELIIFPQMIYLTMFKNVKYKVGAQNFYSYNEGSFTGETNIKALKSINVWLCFFEMVLLEFKAILSKPTNCNKLSICI